MSSFWRAFASASATTADAIGVCGLSNIFHMFHDWKVWNEFEKRFRDYIFQSHSIRSKSSSWADLWKVVERAKKYFPRVRARARAWEILLKCFQTFHVWLACHSDVIRVENLARPGAPRFSWVLPARFSKERAQPVCSVSCTRTVLEIGNIRSFR